MISRNTLTRVAVGLGLVGACTVVDKGDYTFTDNPDATGGDAGDGTGGAQGGSSGSSGNSGTGGTAGEGGEATGGKGGTGGDAGGGTSGDGGGGTGGTGDDCDPPCENGGVCTSSGTCDCADGWEGETCEDDIDDCEPNPCLNGGTCTDHTAAFECACPSQYTGLKCELPRFEIITLGPRSYARAVSADGSVVLGAYANPDGMWRPYFWSSGSMPLGVQGIPMMLRQANVRPNAISGNGLHWVGEYDYMATPGATTPIGGTATQAGMFLFPVGDPVNVGSLLDVDANGTQPVGFVDSTQPNGRRAFIWNSQGMPSELPPPMVGSSMMHRLYEAGATTRDGRITSGSLEDFGGTWFVVHWGGAGVTLPPPAMGPAGTRRIYVHAVSNNPPRVVGSFDDPAIPGLAFVTDGARFNVMAPMNTMMMGPLPSVAWDINDDGTVIVGDHQDMGMGMTGTPGRVAVIWPYQFPPAPVLVETRLRESNVDLRGARLITAYGVSADGKTIVGEAFEMGGGQVGFIARLP